MDLTPLLRTLLVFTFGLIVFCTTGLAQGADTTTQSLTKIIVTGDVSTDSRFKSQEIETVSRISRKRIDRKQSFTVSQAVADEIGVDAQTVCAFCGAKRISINGLKGEHTTLLVDGLSLHSSVSSFYGMDAIPLVAIESIEVYRGTGTVRAAPEAIGGALNFITRSPTHNFAEVSAALSQDGQQSASTVVSRRLINQIGLLAAGQLSSLAPTDRDFNLVAEMPRQAQKSASLKLENNLSALTKVVLRSSYGENTTLGGTLGRTHPQRPPNPLADSSDFVDRDVRKLFIGSQDKISESIRVSRQEHAARFLTSTDRGDQLSIAAGHALQKQDSVYSHGFDYGAHDKLWSFLAEFKKTINDSSFLTFGTDYKDQHLDSRSHSLYEKQSPPLPQDDLKNVNQGLFTTASLIFNESNELDLTLRFDRTRTHWTDTGKTIEKDFVLPRVAYKHRHNDQITSRVSGGLGYRAPLTLLETQHGMNHYGYLINITTPETAWSGLYNFNYQRLDDFFDFNYHVTHLENMAYGIDRAISNDPTLFVNSNEAYDLQVLDFSFGSRITHHWSVEASYERFSYPDGYKSKLPVAAIEQRYILRSDLSLDQWNISNRAIIVPSRDLSKYGYGRHYNQAYTDEDIISPTFGETFVSEQKFQRSPTYFTIDLMVERKIDEHQNVSLNILNIFDYTQTAAGDGPITWDLHGSHYHLDNFHTWGPNRGRQIFLNYRWSI